FVQELIYFGNRTIEGNHFVTVVGHVQNQVLAHYCEPNESNIGCGFHDITLITCGATAFSRVRNRAVRTLSLAPQLPLRRREKLVDHNGPTRERETMLLLLLILVVLALAAVPAWPYSRSWGYYPSGTLGTILVIVLIMMLLGLVHI